MTYIQVGFAPPCNPSFAVSSPLELATFGPSLLLERYTEGTIMIKYLKSLIKVTINYLISLIKYRHNHPRRAKVLSIEETLELAIEHKKSIVRFGDGEFLLMSGVSQDHQIYDEELARLLFESAKPTDNILVCIPESYLTCKNLKLVSRIFWRGVIKRSWGTFERIFDGDYQYGNAFITRPYMIYRKKNDCPKRFELLRSLWEKKRVLIIEGKYSCTGVGNDLLSNAQSIHRVVCPAKDAFGVYNELVSYLNDEVDVDSYDLCLIALGCTAKPLVKLLSDRGLWTIDIGHIDSEYEWFLIGAKNRTELPNKHTADCKVEGIPTNNDPDYLKSIVKRFD